MEEYPGFQKDAGIRVQLADALLSEIKGKNDAATRWSLAEWIQRLHDDYGQEGPIREKLSFALEHLATQETSVKKRLSITDRIEKLHEAYGLEPNVRVELASALCSVVEVEDNAKRRYKATQRISVLYNRFGQEGEVRRLLARALTFETSVADDVQQFQLMQDALEGLWEQGGNDVAVGMDLAMSCLNGIFLTRDWSAREGLAERLSELHSGCPEIGIRFALTMAVLALAYGDRASELRFVPADFLEELNERYRDDPVIKLALLKCLRRAVARGVRTAGKTTERASIVAREIQSDTRAEVMMVKHLGSIVALDENPRAALALYRKVSPSLNDRVPTLTSIKPVLDAVRRRMWAVTGIMRNEYEQFESQTLRLLRNLHDRGAVD